MPQNERTYIAIDLKSYYASVECMERGLDPMQTNLVVADPSRTEKTICLAVSPALKAYGIPGRARLFEVVERVRQVNAERQRRAPGGRLTGKSADDLALKADASLAVDYLVAPPRMAKYIEVSMQIYGIYLKYISPEDIHTYSIDEVLMDVTGYLETYRTTARELARAMILDVLHTTGITATAGIGSNLYLCKVAMDMMAKRVPPDENGVRIKTPFVSYGNWVKNFFQTGWTATNSLSVSGKINKNNSIRLSVTDYRSESIVPNSPWSKQSLSLKSHNKVNKWLTMDTSLTYYRRDNDNLPVMGYGSSSIMYSLWCMAPNINMDWARDYWIDPGVQQNANLTGAKNNPYFVAYECLNTLDRDRIFGNTSLDLHLYKGLDLMLRGGIDFSRDHRTMRQPKSSYSQRYGMYREGNVSSLQLSTDFLLKYDRKLGAGFDMKLNFGGSIINRMFRETTQTAEQLKQPGVYSLANSVERVKPNNYDYERQTNSLYGLIQISWRDAVFLDITGRNDWSSTLPVNNNSYFYPSVSASVLLNELIDFGAARNVVNLVKLRGSFAQVGHDTQPYRTTDYLSSSDFAGNYQIPGTMNNANLRPEIVSSREVGLDQRMFRNRLGVDLAYYNNTSKDLIVNMPVSSASGVTKRFANAGTIRNYGWELQINGTLIKTRDVQWKAYVNWSKNRNEVVDLGEGVDSWIVASYSSHAYMTAYKGGSLSAMYGLGYKRAPEGAYIVEKDGSITNVSGQIIVDENGYPQYSDELQYIGECTPDWKGGFGTSVKWKGLTVSVAFDGQHGGNVYSYTNAVLGTRGKGSFTLAGRYDGLVLDGVNQLPDGNFIRNTHKTADIVEYYGLAYAFQNCEQNFVSTEFLKLREIRIAYEFPRQLLARSKFIKGLSLSVYGRNLYCWSKFPGWDPEGAFMRGASVVPGFEMLQMPGTATFGGNVRITF